MVGPKHHHTASDLSSLINNSYHYSHRHSHAHHTYSNSSLNRHQSYTYNNTLKLFLDTTIFQHNLFYTINLLQAHPFSHHIHNFYPTRFGHGLVLIFNNINDATNFLTTPFENELDYAELRPTISRKNAFFFQHYQHQRPTKTQRQRRPSYEDHTPMTNITNSRQANTQQSPINISTITPIPQPRTSSTPTQTNTRSTTQRQSQTRFYPPPDSQLHPCHDTKATQTTTIQPKHNSTQTSTHSSDKSAQTRNHVTFSVPPNNMKQTQTPISISHWLKHRYASNTTYTQTRISIPPTASIHSPPRTP